MADWTWRRRRGETYGAGALELAEETSHGGGVVCSRADGGNVRSCDRGGFGGWGRVPGRLVLEVARGQGRQHALRNTCFTTTAQVQCRRSCAEWETGGKRERGAGLGRPKEECSRKNKAPPSASRSWRSVGGGQPRRRLNRGDCTECGMGTRTPKSYLVMCVRVGSVGMVGGSCARCVEA